MRRPILAANWKMHKTASEAAVFAAAFLPLVKDADGVDIAIAPPFTALDRTGRALAGSRVALAAQNVSPEDRGAFTGEVAAGMLAELGCSYTIVGHSERRSLYGENDALVARKAAARRGPTPGTFSSRPSCAAVSRASRVSIFKASCMRSASFGPTPGIV